MGVKGLQSFMERSCPESCVTVDLREIASQHAATPMANTTSPTLVVDGMACLCHWYSCRDWVCGGQWKEYIDLLESWVKAFTSAGIRLVFFFDGVVEEQKRREWVKRRRRVNRDISKIFHHIKAHGEQPGRNHFCLPPGISTFTRFALRSLGQEVFCSVREADYEIANFARQHGCMGILGQDSDFVIFNSAPYFSVAKLRIDRLTTVLYDRQRLCQAIGLTVAQLPVLACLLGNDVVSEEQMQNIRNQAMATCRMNSSTPQSGPPQGQLVLAVSQLVSSLWGREEETTRPLLQSLNLSPAHRELLERGIRSYLLSEQEGPQGGNVCALPSACAFEKHVSPEILKDCREKHIAAEGFMVYNIICEGLIECSNTLEDEEDTELLPQALVYKPCRQHLYGLLLPGKEGSSDDVPAIKEWFVYPGNPLQEPDMVYPVPPSLQYGLPSLDFLWFGIGPKASALRLKTFLSVFDCQELSELYGAIEDSLLAALCLITYITLQVQTVSREDIDAYLSQAVCLRLKSHQELQQIQLPFVCSRGVQLGSLYVRGLGHLLGANCASGCPLPSVALMPWHSFDGRLFHSKYLLAHSGADETVLLESDPPCLSLFHCLRDKLIEMCMKKGRVLQSRPNAPEPSEKPASGPRHRESPRGWHPGGGDNWRDQGRRTRGGWRGRGEARGGYGNRQWERGGGGGQHFHPHPHSYPEHPAGGHHDMKRHPEHPRGPSYRSRGRYQLAPRWSQPPAPGT